MDDDQAKVDLPFQPGTIKRIVLQNFMCHEKFDLELGPRVNFIIGPNGSGKSALLTAIVVVLGGRATTTSRARKVSDFVQEGKKYARITCTIHNYDKVMDRELAFKPDDFGKEIVIEKIIYKDEVGGTRLVLKDERMRKVSERKQMLDDMLEHFNILINNPICILNQEVSKSFLHSKRSEDKFDLFMKATNLEQIENDYDEAKDVCQSWQGINTKKSEGFKRLDRENAELKEKTNFINNRLKLQSRSEELNIEKLWAALRDNENEIQSVKEAERSILSDIDKNESDISKREDAISTAESEMEQLQGTTNSVLEDLNALKTRSREHLIKEEKFRPDKIRIQHAIDGGNSKLGRLDRVRDQLENNIKKLRTKLGNLNTQAADEARRKLELERLEYEVTTEKANEQTKRGYGVQLSNSMTELRTDCNRANLKLNDMRSNLGAKQSALRRLIGGRESELRKYGDHMVKICAEVDAAYNSGHFKKKPLGPLGFFIKLRNPKVATALEVHLKGNAYAFTVDNFQDMTRLKSIFRRVRSSGIEFKDPIILTRAFRQKHDISSYRAVSDRYSTLLDLVDIDDAGVFNALVDRTSLENVLFIEDYFEAQNLMLTPASVPRNTRMAYTANGDVMFPRSKRGGFRIVANNRKNQCLFSKGNDEQIRALKQEIEDLQNQIELSTGEVKRLQQSYDEQRSEYEQNQKELRIISERLKEKEDSLFKIKTATPLEQPPELCDLEAELDDCMTEIRDTKVNIEKAKLEMERIVSQIEELDQKKKIHSEMTRQKEGELQKINFAISSKRDVVANSRLAMQKSKMIIDKLKKMQTENNLKLEKLTQNLEAASALVANRRRPAVVRSTEEINDEVKKVERQLQVEIDENQDPKELLASYQKRMEEISKIGLLRARNEKNFKLSEKSLKEREDGVSALRDSTCGSVGATFASLMRAMGMEGKMCIHFKDHVVGGNLIAKAKTLEMYINTSTQSQRPSLSSSDRNAPSSMPSSGKRVSRTQPQDGPQSKRARLAMSPSEKENQRMTDTRSLSGGERSFSTVAFVLALWHKCASPFKLMDEIDVFMDMVTRRMSYNALIRFAEATESPGQFIYFSPLQLPEIDASKGFVKVLAMPCIVRRGQTQSASLGADGGGNE